MEQVARFEPKPSLLMCLPPRYQLGHPPHPVRMSPTHLDLLGGDGGIHGNGGLPRNHVTQTSLDTSDQSERPIRGGSGHNMSSLAASKPWGPDSDRGDEVSSLDMKNNVNSMKDGALTSSLDLAVSKQLTSRSRGSPSPVKDRVLGLGPHRHPLSLLAGGPERVLYHPYSNYSTPTSGHHHQHHHYRQLLHQHQHKHHLQQQGSGHDTRLGEEEISEKPNKMEPRNDLDFRPSHVIVSSSGSPEHHQHQHNHRYNTSNTSNKNKNNSNTTTTTTNPDQCRVDPHNHSSDSGLNDSNTSAVSLDIDTSDSGVVSGISAHTISSDDDVTGVSCSGTQYDDEQLPITSGVDRPDNTRRKLNDNVNDADENEDDDEDIRVSSNDDDDDEDGLRGFDRGLHAGQRTPTGLSAGGTGRVKQSSDDKIGAHHGDGKGKRALRSE
ncbi:hypothetical protein EGW08_018193 [Elysia chlorotica]|uniref:Uncharacterized protein n=1 Tax=Elysia chlorotica TaxID=188477 RepID=A0A433SXL0_ELYCH|nr:hypothetical protein EGW08_018193 [Elysia chlorotica]